MRQVTGSMAGVVKGMEGAMRAMDLEKVPMLSQLFIYTPFLHSTILDYILRFGYFLILGLTTFWL